MQKNKICVLSIAGSDSGAGAGIQSDIKTFKNNGVYGLSVITAITAQNTKGVQRSFILPAKVIEEQLKSVSADFKIKALKTGMMGNSKIVGSVASYLKKNKTIKSIIDPVIFSKNKYPLLDKQGVKAMKKELFPYIYLLTPNIPEAEILTGLKIEMLDELETAAIMISELGVKNVLIKGGHLKSSIGLPVGTDVLFDGKKFYMFTSNYVATKNTHGIGCTLSSAITANIAKGYSLVDAIESAKEYVVRSLKKTQRIGRGFSPVEQ
jgi:hydroxymethylpyrimidine/phosphomethylpyrimidine kinase